MSLIVTLFVVELLKDVWDAVSYVLVPELQIEAALLIEVSPLQILLVQIEHDASSLFFIGG